MTTALSEFDLQPDTRILPMLGEINLAQWRCIAELIDNSVDGFIHASNRGELVATPTVEVNLPTIDAQNARITVRDNGPGMTPEVLERAVRAGWTGNNPIGNLGMFGMGFNIATARLGTQTTVWTATKDSSEWHGLKIDFDELRRQRHFRTPHLTRPKAVREDHGTEVAIERIKPDQRQWLSKPSNLSQVRKLLSETYSAMLRTNGTPLHYRLNVNGRSNASINHCVWNESRSVTTARWGVIPAVINLDTTLPERKYCVACWQWLSSGEEACPACGSDKDVVARKRRVHGWIGVQRFLSTSEYGIDFIRNGRKIEIANKDLFEWHSDTGTELEYPVDDPRSRGRFVGEIHLDHARVTYTKDRFDRADPAWDEMVRLVRGDGPLRPEKAAAAGFGLNNSPLNLLFQGYRRSLPHNARIAGAWGRVLAVKDNGLAEEMYRQFQKGEPDYQDDTKWWNVVVEEDNLLLTPPTIGAPTIPTIDSPISTPLPGFSVASDVPTKTPYSTGSAPEGGFRVVDPPARPNRTPIASLSRTYIHDESSMRWDIRAYVVSENDPALPTKLPWSLMRRPTGEEEFLINTAHEIFRSATLTPLDALLNQLAFSVVDFVRGQPSAPKFASVLSDLRARYAATLKLDPVAIKSQADSLFLDVAKRWSRGIDEKDLVSLFDEDLTSVQKDSVYAKMAVRGIGNARDAVAKGRFLEFAPPRVVLEFVKTHPELFFDGRCWEDDYSGIQFPSEGATAEARLRVLRHYESLLMDAVWLVEQEAGDLAVLSRERLLRATLALDLLTPVSFEEEGGA